MIFRTLRFQDRHKFVRQLKKYLNELVQPTPNLPDDDILDGATVRAIITFKIWWGSKNHYTFSSLTGKGEADVYTWGFIGKALGSERLRRELINIKDYELRTLLLGMDAFAAQVKYYTPEMEACDAKIASVLGGKNAVAAANGFEPEGIALQGIYGFYRGDTINHFTDGKEIIGPGHLSRYIRHLYGSKDGTRLGADGKTYTEIYIPAGFEIKRDTLSQILTPTQAIVHFYYKKLGNVEDVTLLLMHVKGFKPRKEGNRWYIGQIGGRGGVASESKSSYLHSHFVLLKGDVGLGYNKGKYDDYATHSYRESIGIRFVDAFC